MRIKSITVGNVRLQLPTGAGAVALRIFPSGMIIFNATKTAFIDGRIGRHERFERNPRRRHGAGLAGIDRARHLFADLGKIDDHLAARDFDLHLEWHGCVEIDAVTVEQRFGFVLARLDTRDLLTRQRLGLMPDRSHTTQESFQSVTFHQCAQAAVADAAGGDLRAQIAEAGFSETHIVGDDLKNILVGLLAAVKFQRAKLQTFFVNFPRAAETETDRRAADIDPVRAHGEETPPARPRERTAYKPRHC